METVCDRGRIRGAPPTSAPSMPTRRNILPERLRTIRAARNLTQLEVAAGIGTSQVNISRWEDGTHRLKAEDLVRLAEFYQVSSDYLVGLAEHPTGLPVHRWMLDTDIERAITAAHSMEEVNRYRDADGILEYLVEVPANPRVVTTKEAVALRNTLEEKLARLRARRTHRSR